MVVVFKDLVAKRERQFVPLQIDCIFVWIEVSRHRLIVRDFRTICNGRQSPPISANFLASPLAAPEARGFQMG